MSAYYLLVYAYCLLLLDMAMGTPSHEMPKNRKNNTPSTMAEHYLLSNLYECTHGKGESAASSSATVLYRNRR
jgi:hypothetical protein